MINITFPTLVTVILASWALCGGAVPPSFMRRRKGRKEANFDQEEEEEQEDFISQLPDDVLVSIISRIPTRTAVSTSILSKRWSNLYKSVSSIELSYMDLMPGYPRDLHPLRRPGPHISESDFRLVIYRLDRFLRLRSGSKIHHFTFYADLFDLDSNQFQQCILHHLGKSSVERFTLYFSCKLGQLSASFSCDLVSELATLKDLKLVFCTPLPPGKGKWNSLTNLSLVHCEVPPGFCECILSNCSNLESLTILTCVCPPKLCIAGPSLRLKTLLIKNSSPIQEIKLHARNLSKFEYSAYNLANMVFDYVPQLETMNMTVEAANCQVVNLLPFIFGEVARYVPSLKFLRFDTKLDFNDQEVLWIGRSRFWQLRMLNVNIGFIRTPSYPLGLIPYLESCPVLEELQLNLPPWVREVGGGVSDEVIGEVLLIKMRNLKKVVMKGFRGMNNEIELALRILKSAPSLHQMCIIRWHKEDLVSSSYYGHDPWTRRTLKNIKQRLLGQALSPTATLIFRDF